MYTPKTKIFGDPDKLNKLGTIAVSGFSEIKNHCIFVYVDKFIVMPNHIHVILILKNGAPPLPNVVGQYKSYVAREIHKVCPDIQVWQTSFHEHIIRNEKSYEKIWNYIDGNPLKILLLKHDGARRGHAPALQ